MNDWQIRLLSSKKILYNKYEKNKDTLVSLFYAKKR
jgi:hypothetical protein